MAAKKKAKKAAPKKAAPKKAAPKKAAPKKAAPKKGAPKKAAPKKAVAKAAPKPVAKAAPKPKGNGAVAFKPPVDRDKLTTPEEREAALDTLAKWFVDALAGATQDGARATQVIRDAIGAFYDIREAAEQERGEYAGHFFMVDAVGIDNTDRPVPWVELEKRVGPDVMHRFEELFTEIEPDVE